MADGKKAGASSVQSKRKSEKPNLPFRRFKDRPSEVFVKETIELLRKTAQPETDQELYRNPLPKDVAFVILRPDIVLDRSKRPDGDHAPCPMCAVNKFLHGSLIYVPSMECCAVIGHCCADKQTRADAVREYRARSKRDYEESYLLNNLPLIPQRLMVLEELKPVAAEVQRLYRQFRKQASKIQLQLRYVKRNYGGHLTLTEIIRGGEDGETDYYGPAGIKGSDVETRTYDLGIMAGDLATVNDYRPVVELETLIRQLSSIDPITDETELVDFICAISEKQRAAAVAIMEGVDKGVAKFVERTRNFLEFFTKDNVDRLNAYGTHSLNPQPFRAEFGLIKGRPSVVFTYSRVRCALLVGEACHNFGFVWPGKY